VKDELTRVGSGAALHVEIADERDPVRGGGTARATLTVRTEGSAAIEGVALALAVAFGGPPVCETVTLGPGEVKLLRAEAPARETGLHRFRGSVRLAGLDGAAWVEESVAVTD
jgi:hypothetical protein